MAIDAVRRAIGCYVMVPYVKAAYYETRYMGYIDQVWGQYGWILAKLFFCVFMDRDGVESKNSQRRSEANIQPSWPNKLDQ